ncbi:AlpA family transcriptional regulator [Stappia sp. MMSF_3263]|uniref:helix-turn-helix transcriptional regulator n=1 Tax=Stappia sp. MMSF_3263 TaxID=3046693 RepID=UPI00273D4D25|nr:AlpA family phage regulatory protein [Stappia sp. MMSF_3263]
MPHPEHTVLSATVLARTGLSRSAIYRKIAEDTFPAQLKFSTNSAGWREPNFNRWVADPVRWRSEEEIGHVRLDAVLLTIARPVGRR